MADRHVLNGLHRGFAQVPQLDTQRGTHNTGKRADQRISAGGSPVTAAADRRGLPVAPEVEGDDGVIAELCESDPSGIRINLDRSKILDLVERGEDYGLARLAGSCRPNASDESPGAVAAVDNNS
jgi:hypothetical protein